MVRLVLEGWLLGLATGPYCLGACMPFMVPYLLAEGKIGWRGNAVIVGEFLAGRLAAYLLFGMAAGWVGGLLQPHISHQMATAALVVTSAMMMLYAVVKGLPRVRACAAGLRFLPAVRMPLVLGFLIGINICPPFLVAAARVLQVGGLTSGAVFFLGFFAGTALYTLPLLAVSPFAGNARLQRIGAISAVLVGGWFLLTALLGR